MAGRQGRVVILFEALIVHRVVESGVLTDEFDGVAVGLRRAVGRTSFGQRSEPLVLIAFVRVAGAASHLVEVFLFVVALVEDGGFGTSA